jgi:Uncharacterized protein conserved in bacteria (DUF2252)
MNPRVRAGSMMAESDSSTAEKERHDGGRTARTAGGSRHTRPAQAGVGGTRVQAQRAAIHAQGHSAPDPSMSPKTMSLYAELCGHALVKAHARSGDAIAIGSYLGAGGSVDRAMAWFAEEYADQNERDYDALRDAAASGRVTVETGL